MAATDLHIPDMNEFVDFSIHDLRAFFEECILYPVITLFNERLDPFGYAYMAKSTAELMEEGFTKKTIQQMDKYYHLALKMGRLHLVRCMDKAVRDRSEELEITDKTIFTMFDDTRFYLTEPTLSLFPLVNPDALIKEKIAAN